VKKSFFKAPIVPHKLLSLPAICLSLERLDNSYKKRFDIDTRTLSTTLQ